MAKAEQQEKRRDLRVTFRTTARLRFSEGRDFDKCETSDISVGGVFVLGVDGVACGERCEVEFHLTGRTSSLTLELTGEVVRLGEGGVALQFLEVDQDSFYHLQNIVFFNYQEKGQPDESAFAEILSVVDDEALYLGLGAGKSGKPLSDHYLASAERDDDYGDDLDGDIVSRTGHDRDLE